MHPSVAAPMRRSRSMPSCSSRRSSAVWSNAEYRCLRRKWVPGAGASFPAVTAYVLTVVSLLLFMFGLMVMATPRVFATAWGSFLLQLEKARLQFGHGQALSGVLSCVQMVAFSLPVGGLVLMFARTGKRAGT